MGTEVDLTFTVPEIESVRARLGSLIVETPVWRWEGSPLAAAVGSDTAVFLKLEIFQRAGSFKPRGALNVMFEQEAAVRQRGVVAASAGNHALAVAYAAHAFGAHAQVVMPRTANPARVAGCRSFGAEVVVVEDMPAAFAEARRLESTEGRVFVHPFEGRSIALGTATLGLELARQIPDLDAVIIPVGGGGLAAGMSAAFRLIQPGCQLFGAEPEGANAIYRSFRSGQTEVLDRVRTIADSLGSPRAEPYSLALCRKNLDDVVLVSDDQIRTAMGLLFADMKLAIEPAAAVATAALCGPLRDHLRGKRVAVIVCGSNIDLATYVRLISPLVA